ncbi:MAG: hypothetical protein ABW080_17865 [Candidatus Thiodiazotropha sp.]
MKRYINGDNRKWFRVGGDEFVAILQGEVANETYVLSEKIREGMAPLNHLVYQIIDSEGDVIGTTVDRGRVGQLDDKLMYVDDPYAE